MLVSKNSDLKSCFGFVIFFVFFSYEGRDFLFQFMAYFSSSVFFLNHFQISCCTGIYFYLCNYVIRGRRNTVVFILFGPFNCKLNLFKFSFSTVSVIYDIIDGVPLLHLNAVLKIPNIIISPNINEVQECLVQVGKFISDVPKGVVQWTAGKTQQVSVFSIYI